MTHIKKLRPFVRLAANLALGALLAAWVLM